MAKIDDGELLVRIMPRAGMDRVYTLHGGHSEPIYQAELRHGRQIIDVRHEVVAGHAAEGHARSTGCPGSPQLRRGRASRTSSPPSPARGWTIPVIYVAGAPPLRDAEHTVLQGGIDQVQNRRVYHEVGASGHADALTSRNST